MAMCHPDSILRSRLNELSTLLPGVRDAQVDAVHDARVVTRRLRELLPIAGASESDSADALEPLRLAGRAMGKVRELDVLHALLDDLDGRATFAVRALAEIRRDVQDARVSARRRMLKELERLKLDAFARRFRGRNRFAASTLSFGSHWPRRLGARISERATALNDALQRVGGVYMPNRSHAARVAVKKLRYTLELANDTGLWNAPGPAKALRRAQALLGDMHDLQVLVERVEQSTPRTGDVREWMWLRDLLKSDIGRLHRRFVERRERLETAMNDCLHWAGPMRSRWSARSFVQPLAVSAAVLSILAKSNR
jgi:CHAD domain-containing protein